MKPLLATLLALSSQQGPPLLSNDTIRALVLARTSDPRVPAMVVGRLTEAAPTSGRCARNELSLLADRLGVRQFEGRSERLNAGAPDRLREWWPRG